MIRLAISVEGQTEEEFVNEILDPHLRNFCVLSKPILLKVTGGNQGGGNVSINNLIRNMKKLKGSHHYVTSLVDFYGFKKKENLTVDQLELQILEGVLESSSIPEKTIIPYVQLHEFEGLLFSDVEKFVEQIGAKQGNAKGLRKIANRFPNPEKINDNKNTAPSKRILRIIPEYNKVTYGSLIAKKIGLENIRAKCPRFNCWVTKLESLRDYSQ